MSTGIGKLRFLLYFLLLLAMTACGANNLANLAGTGDQAPGSIAAKMVFADGKTAKRVASAPAFITDYQVTVTGTDSGGKAIPVVRGTINADGSQATVGGIYPGTVTLAIKALSGDVVSYEGFAVGVQVNANATTTLAGSVVMSQPMEKAKDVSCIQCHETSLDATGQNLVAEFKQSGHYTNLSWVSAPKYDVVGTGCAGCHGPNHNDPNPATGRCFECHGPYLNPSHGGGGVANNNCSQCHNSHDTTKFVNGRTIFTTPGLGFTDPNSTYDLANYIQTGRYSLPVGTDANRLAEEASAVTYNKDTDTLFVAGDGGTAVVQVTKKGVLIDSMALAADPTKPQGTYFYDTEGLTYIGGGKFVLAEERYRQVDEFTYAANTTLGGANVRTVKLGTTIGNIGIEGISLDPMTNGYLAVKETSPSGIFQTTIDFAAGTASNGSPTTENSVNLFDPAKTGFTAMNDIFALSNVLPTSAPDYSHILIISASAGKVVKMDRTGNILSTLNVGIPPQNEGVTMDGNGIIYVVGEIGGGVGHPEMLVYAPTTSRQAVGVGSNLYLSFNQPVVAGTGTIVLSNGAGDTRTIAIGDASQVSINGNTVTINPTTDLASGSTYSITYQAGVFKDALGYGAPAVSDPAALSFTTVGTIDLVAPTLTSSMPANNATDVTVSRITLNFSEPVIAGTGSVTVSNAAGDTRTIAIGDTTQVAFSGSTVTITPSTEFSKGSTYSVQFPAGVIKDIAGNPFAGIGSAAPLSFTMVAAQAPPVTATLLITEVNSNAAGGDFFEIYNYGTAAVDLTGWKWDDDSASFTDPTNASFPSVSIGAGQRLVVVNTTDATAFRTAWGLSAGVPVVATGGPGLGSGDAVALFNSTGKVIASFNYKGTDITATDGTVIHTATAAAGVTFVAGSHAGVAYGGSATTSAVWDGVSTSAPAYRAAVVGVNGGFAQPAVSTAIGSPGN